MSTAPENQTLDLALSEATLNALPNHIALIREDGVICYANPAWEDFARTNGDPDLMHTGVGLNYLEVCRAAAEVGDSSAHSAREGMLAVLRGEQSRFEMEYPCHAPWPQGERCFLMSVAPVAAPDFRGLVVTHENITPLKTREASLQAMLEAAPDAILIIRPTGLIAWANVQAERLFGYPREALLGEPVERLIPERFANQHLAHRQQYLAAPRTRSMGQGLELYARTQDGQEIPVDVSLSVVDMETQLVMAAVRDARERKQAELAAKAMAELERSNQDLELFAYMASHDLQEPLRMVASYVQLLAKRYKGRLDSDADEFIGYAVDGASRMQKMINDLLAYSRLRHGAVRWAPVNLESVLQQSLTNVNAALRESGAQVTYDPLPIVSADGSLLTQLFQNLLSNAVKFRNSAPLRVHVSAERAGAGWRIGIRDNGIGIAPEHQERIFKLLQRLHPHHERPGSGIGLAICKKIMDYHGGKLWVESQLGHGATFYFTLPHSSGGQRD